MLRPDIARSRATVVRWRDVVVRRPEVVVRRPDVARWRAGRVQAGDQGGRVLVALVAQVELVAAELDTAELGHVEPRARAQQCVHLGAALARAGDPGDRGARRCLHHDPDLLRVRPARRRRRPGA
ncbi:hypothetical protein GCM10020218_064990 [Dactylosporangium vinaceum]